MFLNKHCRDLAKENNHKQEVSPSTPPGDQRLPLLPASNEDVGIPAELSFRRPFQRFLYTNSNV